MKEYVIKVLLVSDHKKDFTLIRDFLDTIKGGSYKLYWISEFDDCSSRLWKSDDYDIHLVDFHLKSENGLDLIRQVISKGSQTPVILLTGKDDKEIDIEAMKVGVSDYLVKSELDSLTLERTIRYAIENSRTQNALRSSEARFRSVIQNLSDIIAILDDDSKITYISPSIERSSKFEIYRYARAETHRFCTS